MTDLETFRMLTDGELVESESATPDGVAAARTTDGRCAHRGAAAVKAGSV
ncbi:hypothetical protein [Arthrobacter crystallopoietes]|nr:hypothetical protein [Arthrobacter crystallopoietes]